MCYMCAFVADMASSSCASAQRKRGSSSQRTQQVDPPQLDESRFTLENHLQYEARQHKNFIKEKTVALEVDSYFHIADMFQRLGQDPTLSLPNYYFPHLVCEFYANMDGKSEYNGWYIRTHVRGREIQFTRDHLAALLGYRDDGLDIDS